MAAKTTPWWLRAITGVLRGVRAGVAALFRPPKTEYLISQNDLQPESSRIEETDLIEDSPKTNRPATASEEAPLTPAPNPVAEEKAKVPPQDAAPAETPEEPRSATAGEDAAAAEASPQSAAEPEIAEEEPPAALADLLAEAAMAEDSGRIAMPESDAQADPPLDPDPPEPVADLLAEVALGEEALAEPEPEPATDPDPPVAPADMLAEAVTAPVAEPPAQAADASATIEEPDQIEPEPLAGDAMDETIVTPEVDNPSSLAEPEMEIEREAAAEAVLPAVEGASPAPEPPQQSEPEMDATPEPAAAHDIESPELEAVEAATEPVEAAPSEEAAPTEQHPAEALEAQPGTGAEVPPQAAFAPPQMAAAPQVVHREPIKKEEGPDTLPVSVFVNEVYEGPFDLLLDLIRKQDIDIYDIPIARITAQFLVYVNKLKASDMDVAGEFIYTASLLIHIKSKMLLPRNPAGPGEEAEDPRRELVERLLEHERFKNAAQMLQQKQVLEDATWTNPGMREFREDAGAEPEIAADTVDLVRIFREILERARSRPVLNVEEDSVTVGQMIQFLGRRLTMEDKPVALRRLLAHTKSERALIAMFLALLELVRLQAILLRQDREFSEIFIKKNSGFDAVMNEGLARDDWQ